MSFSFLSSFLGLVVTTSQAVDADRTDGAQVSVADCGIILRWLLGWCGFQAMGATLSPL
jgi:hypothetical protein